MKFSKEQQRQIDQHIKLFITDITGETVEFSSLPIYEKIGELTRSAYRILDTCNEQIENSNGYLVTSEMLDEIDELEFMMDKIVLDAAEFRSDLNSRESLND